MKTQALIVSILLFAGCYNTTVYDGMYVCSDKNPYCPDGFSCKQNVCKRTPKTETLTIPPHAPSTSALGDAVVSDDDQSTSEP